MTTYPNENCKGSGKLAPDSGNKLPKVVHGTEPASETAQTPGMERRAAIHKGSVGASKLWVGTVTCLPNQKGPPHHHGDAETTAYIISGRIRVYYGDNFEEYVEAGPGDYLFVPANMLHIEMNPYDQPSEQILIRSPDNIVVNIEP